MRGAPTKAPATVGGRYITLGTKADPSTAQPALARSERKKKPAAPVGMTI
jgi:hypothetical protein